jgi:hypothetical protein
MPRYSINDYDILSIPITTLHLRNNEHKVIDTIPTATFTLFPKLPPEIRNQIWHLTANHPRTITIRESNSFTSDNTVIQGVKHNATSVPSVLHVNAEARDIGLKYYELCFGSQFRRKPVYFNYAVDGILFRFPAVRISV